MKVGVGEGTRFGHSKRTKAGRATAAGIALAAAAVALLVATTKLPSWADGSPGPQRMRVAGLDREADGVRLHFELPPGFTNRVDLYAAPIGDVEPRWQRVAAGLASAEASSWAPPPEAAPAMMYAFGDADTDNDLDELSDAFEFFVAGTNPGNADTDGDSLPDGWEVSQALNPLDAGDAHYSTGTGLTFLEAYQLGLGVPGSFVIHEIGLADVQVEMKSRGAAREKFTGFPAFVQPTNGPPVYYLSYSASMESRSDSQVESAETGEIYFGWIMDEKQVRDFAINPATRTLSGRIEVKSYEKMNVGYGWHTSYLWNVSGNWLDSEVVEVDSGVSSPGSDDEQISAFTNEYTYCAPESFSIFNPDFFHPERIYQFYDEHAAAQFAETETSYQFGYSLQEEDSASVPGEVSRDYLYLEHAIELGNLYSLELLISLTTVDFQEVTQSNEWADIPWGTGILRNTPGELCSEVSTLHIAAAQPAPLRHLSSDEVRLELSESVYRFAVDTVQGRRYRMNWLEHVWSEDAEGQDTEQYLPRSVLFIGNGQRMYIGRAAHSADGAAAYASLVGPDADHSFELPSPGGLRGDAALRRAVDLDIDSLNQKGFLPPDRTPEEDAAEDDPLNGKVVAASVGDADGDGIPDFADGMGLWGENGEGECERFVPLVLEIPAHLDLAKIRIRFGYSASDPAAVDRTGEGTPEDPYAFAPAAGHLRIWTLDGPSSRDPLPVGGGGHFINPGAPLRPADLGAGNRLTLYVEGIRPSADPSDLRILAEVSPSEDGPFLLSDAVRTRVDLRVPMVPDYNRDRKIDGLDRSHALAGKVFYFWINDDNDAGYDEGDDIPGAPGWLSFQDWRNERVDGVRDLLDFFPVHLDLAPALRLLHPSEYTYFLWHSNKAVNVIMPENLTPVECKKYLVDRTWAEQHETAKVTSVDSPKALENSFLQAVQQGTGGVVLLEGTSETGDPLLLDIRRKSDNVLVSRSELPLRLSGVEKMFRHWNFCGNLGADIEVAERGAPGERYPDSLLSERWLVFLHGVNVDQKNARGWHSEMFKKFYWSGSSARFIGVTYRAADGSSANYQHNVDNAFKSAVHLAERVNALPGGPAKRTIAAHSMGNIVVSSAIATHGMEIDRYLMLNAAVATEAYDATTWKTELEGNEMINPDWRDYPSRTWSATWHQLFTNTVDDARQQMTWKNRFAGAVPKAYNFYSSEDEVFEIYDGVLGMLTGVETTWLVWPDADSFARYTWHKQEHFKGLFHIYSPILGSTSWAGWGFRFAYIESQGETTWERVYSAEQAVLASVEDLRSTPAFRAADHLQNPDASRSQIDSLLAKGIPALSPATGRNIVGNINLLGRGNFNMASLKDNGWPRPVGSLFEGKWLHNDIREMAYLYTFDLFDNLTEKGALR